MTADKAVSLGLVVAELAIVLTGKNWIDPLISFYYNCSNSMWNLALFPDSVNLALDTVPIEVY